MPIHISVWVMTVHLTCVFFRRFMLYGRSWLPPVECVSVLSHVARVIFCFCSIGAVQEAVRLQHMDILSEEYQILSRILTSAQRREFRCGRVIWRPSCWRAPPSSRGTTSQLFSLSSGIGTLPPFHLNYLGQRASSCSPR